MKHFVILGAGLSGLATAWFIRKRNPSCQVTLLEKSDRVGGWIQTVKKGGHLFELGPRGFRPKGLGVLTKELCLELGLDKEWVFASTDAKKRYLLLEGKLQSLSPWMLCKKIGLRGLINDLKHPAGEEEDETIDSFFSRHFHPSFMKDIVSPCLQGIFGGDCKHLSIKSCLPLIYQWQTKKGSLLKAIWNQKRSSEPPLISFEKGMETLPLKLAEGLTIHFNVQIQKIEEKKVVTSSGTIEGDHMICTLPLPSLSECLPSAYAVLHPLPFVSLTTVSLSFSVPVLRKSGFGYLVACEKEKGLLGMTFDSAVFPQQNRGAETRLCALLRGIFSEKEALLVTKEALSKHLKIKESPEHVWIQNSSYAVPQFPVGFQKRLRSLSPSLAFVGQSYGAIGVNGCIHQAHLVAQKLF